MLTCRKVLILLFVIRASAAFISRPSKAHAKNKSDISRILSSSNPNEDSTLIDDAERINPEVARLKAELFELASCTNRGFQATSLQKSRAKEIVYNLARFNPSKDPAIEYYNFNSFSITNDDDNDNDKNYRISGKWTLIYTDAPDITSLDTTSWNPFATTKLGRIGQECKPPYIKNVIEWLRPDWAQNIPLSGSDNTRIIQKIVTSASATPTKEFLVYLKIAGIEIEASDNPATVSLSPSTTPELDTTSNMGFLKLLDNVQRQGIPAGILSTFPIDLKGSLNPSFGRFEILYVDQDLRASRTGQNYIAINQRIQKQEDEWFW